MIHHEQKYDCRLCSYCGKGHSGLKCDKQVISEQAEQIRLMEQNREYNKRWKVEHTGLNKKINAQAAEIKVYKKALTEIKSIGHHLPLSFRSNSTDTISMIVSKALAAKPQKGQENENTD